MSNKYIIQFPKIGDDAADFFVHEDDDIVIQEKIDGANFRFSFLSDGLYFGSRENNLNDNAARFKPCMDYVRKRVSLTYPILGFVFFGECCVPHRLQYDWEDIPPFVGYDVYNPRQGAFVSDPESYFEALCLPYAPVVKRCKAGEIKSITEDLIPMSAYGNVRAEGVVFKNYKKQHFFKFVRQDFAEKKSNRDYSVDTHLTTARVEKMVWKLVDEGHDLGVDLMHHLPTRVAQDIVEESGTQKGVDAVEKQANKFCYRALMDVLSRRN